VKHPLDCGREMAIQAGIQRRLRRGDKTQAEPGGVKNNNNKRTMGSALKSGVDYTNGIGQKQWEFWTRPLFDDGQGKQHSAKGESKDRRGQQRQKRRRSGDAERETKRGKSNRRHKLRQGAMPPDMLTCVPTRGPSEFTLGPLPMQEAVMWAKT